MNMNLKVAILKSKFKNQYEFAQAVGFHESDISRVIFGRRELSPEQKQQWADTLGVKLEEIFTDGEANPKN
jgi:plasmid maintenance system antidote protein VapI